MTEPELDLTDRQARAVIAAAEALGFAREPYLLWWRYDKTLHDDAANALAFLRDRHPELVDGALTAADPLPVWVAVDRIMDERGGLHLGQADEVIEAAVEAGLMDRPVEHPPWICGEWDTARVAVELLWQHDPGRLEGILGHHVQLAMSPETAMYPCPSVCERGWVTYKYAGELPAERPEHWHSPY